MVSLMLQSVTRLTILTRLLLFVLFTLPYHNLISYPTSTLTE